MDREKFRPIERENHSIMDREKFRPIKREKYISCQDVEKLQRWYSKIFCINQTWTNLAEVDLFQQACKRRSYAISKLRPNEGLTGRGEV